MTPPVALTIAGSDSGGGAGVQADLRTFAAHRVLGTSALTAVTAQNTVGVHRVDVLDPDAVGAQIDAVTDDLRPRAAKTGMLATVGIIDVVAGRAATGSFPPLVVDPVMVASSGDRLLDRDAEAAYRELLFPRAAVITPNLVEASVLLGEEVRDRADMADAAAALAGDGPDWVVITGGHLTGHAVDVVHDTATGRSFELVADRIDTTNVHGTGCSFASAVAANLALGHRPETAIRRAKEFVTRAIAGAAAWRLGAGHGPIDHLGWTTDPADRTTTRPAPDPGDPQEGP